MTKTTEKMMTLDDLCELYVDEEYGECGTFQDLRPNLKDRARKAMRAVLETHVKPMLAEAFAAGDRKIPAHGETPEGYATRLLASLTEEKHND